MSALDDDHTGTRIRRERKLAHLTQRQLADRIPFSYSLLNQVECGARRASPDLVAAVAHALRIDVTALAEQPYVTELQQDRLAELVRPLRRIDDRLDHLAVAAIHRAGGKFVMPVQARRPPLSWRLQAVPQDGSGGTVLSVEFRTEPLCLRTLTMLSLRHSASAYGEPANAPASHAPSWAV